MTHEEIDLLSEQAKEICESDSKRSLALCEQAINAALSIGYEKGLMKLYRRRGVAQSFLNNHAEAREDLLRALDLSRQLTDVSHTGDCLINLGISYGATEDQWELAIVTIREGLTLAQASGNRCGQTWAYAYLSFAYGALNDPVNSIECARAACIVSQGTPEEPAALGTLAAKLCNFGNPHGAIELLQKALILAKSRQPSRLPQILAELGRSHGSLGDVELSLQYFLEAFNGCSYKDNVHCCSILQGIARALKNLGRAEESLPYIKRSFDLAAGVPSLLAYCHELYVGSFRALGRFDEAKEHLMLCQQHIMQTGGAYNLLVDYHETAYELFEEMGEYVLALKHLKEKSQIEHTSKYSEAARSLNSAHILVSIEREKHETEMQKARAEQSEKELGNTTLHLLAQTELLSDLRSDLLQIARKIPPQEPAARELRERVKNLPCQSIDWEKFDTQFKAAHPEFVKKLLERFTDLTPMETRVCTLLRLNLKSHEIAKMFCLEERSIETHRFNIRKKLKLAHEQSLSNFLNSL